MGTPRLHLLGAAAVAALVVSLAAAPAIANRRVVVLDVEGRRTGGLEKSLRGMVAEHNELVSAREYRVTARKLRAKSRSARHLSRVATRLDADAVVDSELERHRRGYMLRIVVRDAEDGRVIKRLAVSMSNRTLSRRLQKKLAGKLDEAIARSGRAARVTAKEKVARKTTAENKKKVATRPPPKPKKKTASKPAPKPKQTVASKAPPKQGARKERTAAPKPQPRKKPRSVDDRPFDMDEKFDSDGNVVDDEMPAVLRR
ncbi:MAG TPA: hypothetical protein VML75_06830 [Kofleriaceae bacterium]|nr:hypothetical protein [Kofleriaceae bacterium]